MIFTVSVGSVIATWVFDYTKTTIDSASVGISGTSGVVSCANQIIKIKDVSVNSNGGTLTTFNDSASSKTFSSPSGKTATVWMKLPKNATIKQTKITITGQQYGG